MKKILLPALAVLSVTLFSFGETSEKVFQLESDGNYSISDGSKIEQQDWDLMRDNTKLYDGTADLKDYKTKIVILDYPQTRIYVADKVPADPQPKEVMDYLLTKYN